MKIRWKTIASASPQLGHLGLVARARLGATRGRGFAREMGWPRRVVGIMHLGKNEGRQ